MPSLFDAILHCQLTDIIIDECAIPGTVTPQIPWVILADDRNSRIIRIPLLCANCGLRSHMTAESVEDARSKLVGKIVIDVAQADVPDDTSERPAENNLALYANFIEKIPETVNARVYLQPSPAGEVFNITQFVIVFADQCPTGKTLEESKIDVDNIGALVIHPKSILYAEID